ncbi:hypothetical protein POM88_017406 [Heracleum sosnowskyi]|uniref:Uncharacterized protein n=1 Tax=Heracleum sosnowskyi TaxID=360622 RepID=A0AAD8IQ90_9APIA|nr:hypothetical protein POM88_017406 [Heracleum sosnowskyi]
MAILLVCYQHFTITINGVGYGIMQVPKEVFDELDWEEQLELIFLEVDYLRARYEHEEAMRRTREAAHLRRLEEQERIIGFAITMSKILHRKEEMRKKHKKEDPCNKPSMVKWFEDGHPEGEAFKFTPIQLEVHFRELQSLTTVVKDTSASDVETTSRTVLVS